jgi:hypothetical protein
VDIGNILDCQVHWLKIGKHDSCKHIEFNCIPNYNQNKDSKWISFKVVHTCTPNFHYVIHIQHVACNNVYTHNEIKRKWIKSIQEIITPSFFSKFLVELGINPYLWLLEYLNWNISRSIIVGLWICQVQNYFPFIVISM